MFLTLPCARSHSRTHAHTHTHTTRNLSQGNETEEKVFERRKVFKEDWKELIEVVPDSWSLISKRALSTVYLVYLSTLYLLACQVRVTVGGSGLCCCV